MPQLNVEAGQPFVEPFFKFAEGIFGRGIFRIAHDIPTFLWIIVDPTPGLQCGKLAVHGLSGQMQDVGDP